MLSLSSPQSRIAAALPSSTRKHSPKGTRPASMTLPFPVAAIVDRRWGLGQRWLLTGCLTGLAVLGNWVPGWAGQTPNLGGAALAWSSGGVVMAQTPSAQDEPPRITTEEVEKYAVAALALENARQELANQIGANAMAGRSCGDVGQVSGLDPAIVNYCQNSKKIVEDTGLTADRFNLIYLRQRSDTKLRLDILGIMARTCIDDNNRVAPTFCRDTIRPEMKKQCAAQGSQIAPSVCLRLRIED